MRSLYIRAFLLFTIGLCLFAAAWVPLHGDIHYFSDNARDMLLLNEIVTEKPITLIGPRSGISGVFHGPLWLYMNLPVFALSVGNPVAVGWFWWMLYVLNVGIVFVVGRCLSGVMGGLVAGLLFAYAFVSTGWSQFNANGVLLVSPLVMYFLHTYLVGGRYRDALILFFFIGLLIQFQIAFGLPVLLLVMGLVGFRVVKERSWKHVSSLLVLLIPLSTHILFDIRHGFLQLNSLLAYAGKSGGSGIAALAQTRLPLALRELTNWLPHYSVWTSVALLVGLVAIAVWKKNHRITSLATLFAFLYVGFWLITLGYSGTMWLYYYWGFVPMLFIVIGAAVQALPQRIHASLVFVVALCIVLSQLHWFVFERNYAISPRPISWKFHKSAVEKVYQGAPNEFGYYIFEDDLYGYGPKYAFVYNQKHYPHKQAFLNEKRGTTYTYLMPTQSDTLSWDGWIKGNVLLKSSPARITEYPNGVAINEYRLSKDEQAVPSDPNLLDSLMFR